MEVSDGKRNRNALGFLFGIAAFAGVCYFVMGVFGEYGVGYPPEVPGRAGDSRATAPSAMGESQEAAPTPAPSPADSGVPSGNSGMMADPSIVEPGGENPVPQPPPSPEALRKMEHFSSDSGN